MAALFRTLEYPKLPILLERIATKTGKGGFYKLADFGMNGRLPPRPRLAPRLGDRRRPHRHHQGHHPVTGRSRTRLDRVRAAAEIIQLALQQIEDDLRCDTVTAQELAEILREFHREADPQSGVLGKLAQLLTVGAQIVDHLNEDDDGDTSTPLYDAVELLTQSVSLRLHWATRALDPQGESA